MMATMAETMIIESVDGRRWRCVPQDSTCKRHGSARCPQEYMLAPDGLTVKPRYVQVWADDLRCPPRQLLYTLTVWDARDDQPGWEDLRASGGLGCEAGA